MPFVDEPQTRLGLDLGVLERALRERDRGALPVDDPLARGVALTARALQRDVEHSHGQVVSLPEPERHQRQEAGAPRGGRGETGCEGGLHLLGGRHGRASRGEPLLGLMDPRDRLEAGMAARLLGEALEVLTEAGAQRHDRRS